jgi:hypothetical protein
MSNWQAEQAERNRKSLTRLSKSLPGIFPAAVLARALSRPFISPTPRLAIDSFWRAHPIRADRLARALAARSGAPKGWTWQLGHNPKTVCRPHSEHRQRHIERAPMRGELDPGVYAGSQFIASAGKRD